MKVLEIFDEIPRSIDNSELISEIEQELLALHHAKLAINRSLHTMHEENKIVIVYGTKKHAGSKKLLPTGSILSPDVTLYPGQEYNLEVQSQLTQLVKKHKMLNMKGTKLTNQLTTAIHARNAQNNYESK